MRRDIALTKLRAIKPGLERDANVSAIGIFGSTVRDAAGPTSDIDILVAFHQAPGYFAFLSLQDHLSSEFGVKVDLVTAGALHPALKEGILRETVYV